MRMVGPEEQDPKTEEQKPGPTDPHGPEGEAGKAREWVVKPGCPNKWTRSVPEGTRGVPEGTRGQAMTFGKSADAERSPSGAEIRNRPCSLWVCTPKTLTEWNGKEMRERHDPEVRKTTGNSDHGKSGSEKIGSFKILSYPVPGMETDGLDADGTAGSGTGLRRESSKCRRCGLSREHYVHDYLGCVTTGQKASGLPQTRGDPRSKWSKAGGAEGRRPRGIEGEGQRRPGWNISVNGSGVEMSSKAAASAEAAEAAESGATRARGMAEFTRTGKQRARSKGIWEGTMKANVAGWVPGPRGEWAGPETAGNGRIRGEFGPREKVEE
ncbi:hypothetical protein B0H12DRAFT_1083215 [Mycena haematopus]|nr:hypothetical protein B0H12DRAFT_1083215 [Mycena haematopus]